MTPYGTRLLDLARAARGTTLAGPTVSASASNPLCGDAIELSLRLEGGIVRGAAYRERGCVIVGASAALLAAVLPGKSAVASRDLADDLGRALADPLRPMPEGLDALAPVRLLPARRRCALLPWEALRQALQRPSEP